MAAIAESDKKNACADCHTCINCRRKDMKQACDKIQRKSRRTLRTCMQFALWNGDHERIKDLLEQGHHVTTDDVFSRINERKISYDTYRLLLKNMKFSKPVPNEREQRHCDFFLSRAVDYNDDESVEALLSIQSAFYTNTAVLLQEAVDRRMVNIVNVMLKKGVNPEEVKMKSTVEPWKKFPSNTRKSTGDEYVEKIYSTRIIRLLMRYGWDIEKKNKTGKTSLHVAIFNDDINLINALLDCGADINSEDIYENTPVIDGIRNIRNPTIKPTLRLHMTKLNEIGMFVSEKNNNYQSRICVENMMKCLRTRWIENCAAEIKKMKEFVIDDSSESMECSHSLYDFTINGTEQLGILFTGNKNFIQLIETDKIDNMFPLYGYLIRIQVQKWMDKRNYLKAENFFIKQGYPDLCTEIILQYLNKRDIAMLTEALSLCCKSNCKTSNMEYIPDESDVDDYTFLEKLSQEKMSNLRSFYGDTDELVAAGLTESDRSCLYRYANIHSFPLSVTDIFNRVKIKR